MNKDQLKLHLCALEGQEKELSSTIADLKVKIEALDEEQVTEEEAEITKLLHSALCHHNHDDGCGWFYEFPNGEINWKGWAHKEYLKMARRAIDALSYRNICSMTKIDLVQAFFVAVKG